MDVLTEGITVRRGDRSRLHRGWSGWTLLIGLGVSSVLLAAAACDSPASVDLESPLDADDLRAHLEALANDEARGRRAGSLYERLAAEYVRARLASFDLGAGAAGYFQAFDIDVPIDGVTGLSSQNVVAVLPGAGSLAGQWIVVGAHYDHLGFVDLGESVIVFNGADDNASGTAMMIEVARVMSGRVRDEALEGLDRRSVLFVAFGAEEVGLVGSNHFCNSPTVAMDSIVAMLNFDMVGRLGANGLILIGASSSPDWPELVQAVNEQGVQVLYSGQALSRSDQYCFYQNQRPILFFHTGLHGQYHTPEDDIARLNIEGMLQVGNLGVEVLTDLILRASPPSFTAESLPTVDEPETTP